MMVVHFHRGVASTRASRVPCMCGMERAEYIDRAWIVWNNYHQQPGKDMPKYGKICSSQPISSPRPRNTPSR